MDYTFSKIERRQKELKITDKHLCEAIDVSPQMFRKYRNGENSFSYQHVMKIAKLLQMHTVEFFEPPIGFMHIYDENRNWVGIIRV